MAPILHHAIDHMANAEVKAEPSSQCTDARLLLAIRYIDAHFAEPVSIGDIARAAGVNSGYFTRFFKTQAGMPPRRYLTEVRFERAKALIRTSSKSMTLIAAECGFADQSHMTAIFRRRVGMTPTAFRDA